MNVYYIYDIVMRYCIKMGSGAGACGILAGDLNLRDDEVRAAQKSLESQVFGDAWSYCGAPEAERWTWDTTVPWSLLSSNRP